MPAIFPSKTMLLQDRSDACAENNALEILGVTCSLSGIAIFVVVLRIYVRAFTIKHVGADDYVILAALLMAIGTTICFISEVKLGGSGRHLQCIDPPTLEEFWKWQYYHSIWVMIGVVLVKISVALFLMRLVPGKIWRRFLWCAIAFLTCFCLACAGTLIFSCIPIEANWDFALKASPKTHCFSKDTYASIGLFNSVIGIITDFIFALMPIPIILRLQMNLRTKLVLAFILSLGLIACAAGIVKARIQATFFSLKDPTWHNSFNVWNMIELCLGIIAASLPALRPLFTQLLVSTKSALGFSGGSSKRSPENSGYRRQRDRQEHNPAGADFGLVDMPKDSQGSDTTTQPPRGYNVRIHSGYGTHAERSWVGSEHGWGESEERLTAPPDAILKSSQISRVVEQRVDLKDDDTT